MSRKLLVRADAGSRMGTGHVMRCLALAQAWQAQGGAATFLSRCESAALRRRVRQAGVRLVSVPAAHPDALDWRTTARLIEKTFPDWLVIDGYHFSPAYQKAARAAAVRVMVIDDTAHWPRYHSDILLNQNLGAEKLSYRCDRDTRMLLGPHYALLRPEFRAWRGRRHAIRRRARRVLVTMGGSDPDNVTSKVIRALGRVSTARLDIIVLIGAGNLHKKNISAEVKRLAAEAPGHSVRVECGAEDVAGLMAWADIAVSAGGSTLWELLFMGVPTAALVVADNQRAAMKELTKGGVVFNLGTAGRTSVTTIHNEMVRLLGDYPLRRRMTSKGRKLVDGRGALAVLSCLKRRSGLHRHRLH